MSPQVTMDFGTRLLGDSHPVLIVAEIGVNHNGELDLALRHVREAAAAGAEAVKLQTYRTDDVVTKWAPTAQYQRSATGGLLSQHEMISALELSDSELAAVFAEGQRLGLVMFSTPFDARSVDLLVSIGAPWMKIPSGEVTNLDLVRAVGRTHLPTMMSTGMSSLAEIHAMVDAFVKSGGGPYVLLQCTSSYPAPLEQMNLRAIEKLRAEFKVPVGLSDHSIGRDAPVAAVALGACALEKHFTVDASLSGPDHSMSMPPGEFRQMVDVIRALEAGGLGSGIKTLMPAEVPIREVARRSVVAAQAIARGTRISREMLALKRPGGGLPPSEVEHLVGRHARRELALDEPLRADDID